MIVVVDERARVREAFASLFDQIGVATFTVDAGECLSWMHSAGTAEIGAIEAFLVGGGDERIGIARAIGSRCQAAVIAVNDQKALAATLALFDAGFDDVISKPFHVREILARIKAIGRRGQSNEVSVDNGGLRIFADGRDVEVAGAPLTLPRRQRRILEYLATNRGCWVTKRQIFDSVYGVFGDDIGEDVVECHVSRLRKQLRPRLGYDPIVSQRHLGYRFECR